MRKKWDWKATFDKWRDSEYVRDVCMTLNIFYIRITKKLSFMNALIHKAESQRGLDLRIRSSYLYVLNIHNDRSLHLTDSSRRQLGAPLFSDLPERQGERGIGCVHSTDTHPDWYAFGHQDFTRLILFNPQGLGYSWIVGSPNFSLCL